MAAQGIKSTDLHTIPHEVGILPLRDTVAYPYMVLPLAVAVPSAIKLVRRQPRTAIGSSA